ncbi:LPD38 domain-containing protein [Maridesulfovibrio ferrireducens]|uniref:LPD38 domain-containing protein n=1 Tax=Maridesulfovibrio ferrireducens TaxID=246191 RepID=UPI001A1870A2|nr:LPD38 domain-containing protein [Maridesulfovibrio ferrireducens]MBI9110309.1 strawberry notch C-terminal domain-containing protein [Maridesulfovibrio ferrireducens]
MDMNKLFDQAVSELQAEGNRKNLMPDSPENGSPVYSFESTSSNSAGLIPADSQTDETAGYGFGMLDPLVAPVVEMGRGVAAGQAGLGESFGGGMQWLGNRVGSDSVAEAGQSIADYYKPVRESYAAPKRLQGNVMDDPSLLARGDWWGYQVGNLAPSLGAAMIPGAAVGKVVQVGGKAMSLTPQVLERLARIGQALGAGAGGGALEGTSTYREVLEKGGSEKEAARAGEMMALASAGLNAISFGKMFSKAGPGVAAKTAKHVTSGAVEGISEWAEEPAESISKDLAHYITTGEMKPGVFERVKQAAKEGVNVIGPAALTGAGGSVMSGPAGLSEEAKASDEKMMASIEQVKQGMTVDLLDGEKSLQLEKAAAPDTRTPAQKMSEFYGKQEKSLGKETEKGFGLKDLIDSQHESPQGMTDLKSDIQDRYRFKPEPELEGRIEREMAMREGWRPSSFDDSSSLSSSKEPDVYTPFEGADIFRSADPEVVPGFKGGLAGYADTFREKQFREASTMFDPIEPQVVPHPDFDPQQHEAAIFNREWDSSLEDSWNTAVRELEEGNGVQGSPSESPEVIEASGSQDVLTANRPDVQTSELEAVPELAQEDIFDLAVQELQQEEGVAQPADRLATETSADEFMGFWDEAASKAEEVKGRETRSSKKPKEYKVWHKGVLEKIAQIKDVATRDSYTRTVSPNFNPRMTADKEKWVRLEGWVDDILAKQAADETVETLTDVQVNPKAKAKEVAGHLTKAAQAFSKINDLLGGQSGHLSLKPIENSDPLWPQIKPLLREAWDEVVAAGKSGRDFAELALKTLSPKGRPYFEKFVREEIGDKSLQENKLIEPESNDVRSMTVDIVVEELKSGRNFKSITEARNFIESELKKRGVEYSIAPGSQAAKEFDEVFEVATVLTARLKVEAGRSGEFSNIEIYNMLVDLYQRQPNLGVRSSTSVANQAYSTPAPIAYLASELAGINEKSSVYEPTAGNGMLALAASEKNTVVNELDEERVSSLEKFFNFKNVHKEDATEFFPGKDFDSVIMNPPFGRVRKEDGQSIQWRVGDRYRTKELDHAIVFQALKAMKDDGRAVLIIGGKKGESATRVKKYRAQTQRAFYATLFNEYNVVDHFSIDGKMYSRQGAAYPIDIIVIDGRGKSSRPQPAAELPHIYESFEELEEKLHGLARQSKTSEDREPLRRSGELAGRKSDGPDDNKSVSSRGSGDSVHGSLLLDSSLGENAADAGTGGRSDRSGSPRGAHSVREVRGYSGETEQGQSISSGTDSNREKRNLETSNDGELLTGRGRVSSPGNSEREGRSGSEGRRSQRGGMGTDGSRVRNGEVETQFQVGYSPASAQTSMQVLTPRNMAQATEEALSRLEKKHGNIDNFVAKELGYSVDGLGKVLAAEQIDSVALAISNFKDGKGFIIGDQTGIGKGRVNAAIIRYAKRNGIIPVFLTEKPNLYGDMIRDMEDIGESQDGIFITNTDKKDSVFEKGDGSHTDKHSPAKKRKLMLDIVNEATDKYSVVFTTYNQLQSLGNKPNPRQQFINGIASRAMFILDESHNAGGSPAKPAKGKIPRSKLIRDILQVSPHGAFYSSATYAKRPDVMDLYFKTDMVKAVDDISQLGEAIASGGVPMQQVVATMLTESGQYVRRERSFNGVTFDTKSVPASKDLADGVGKVMQGIIEFDDLKSASLEVIDNGLKSSGENVLRDGSIGQAGADSTNFTSLMHNVIDQMLLCLKVQATVDMAKEHLKRGEKPVIALANTMGSMVKNYTEDNEIAPGQIIDINFGDLLERYLYRSRQIVVGDPMGEKVTRSLTDDELGPLATRHFNSVLKTIKGIDMSGLPMSPIDFIRQELVNSGYVVDEITGREHAIDYSEADAPTYYRRKKPAPRTVIDGFNDGSIDAVIINCAGSTGLSLHASEKFKDRRPRRMLIAQAEKNIDTFMQTLGRIHRTGQVELPGFTLLNADIPAEKRPAAVLQKKMASLNASTTADSDSAVSSSETLDFMNEHGDKIIAEMLSENRELHRKLGEPLKNFGKEDLIGGARKVTGRIPALPVKEQEEFYDLFESEYREYMENLERSGVSSMKASHLELDAIPLSEKSLTPGKGGSSPFERESKLIRMDVKKIGKPYSSKQVKEQLASANNLEDTLSVADLVKHAVRQTRETLVTLKEEFSTYTDHIKNTVTNSDVQERSLDRAQTAYDQTIRMVTGYTPGSIVVLSNQEGTHTGVVLSIERKGKSDNPAALSRWKVRIALTDATRLYSGSLSRLSSGVQDSASSKIQISKLSYSLESFLPNFDIGQKETREKRHIATGNILAGYAALGNKGKIITFTDHEGRNQPGVLLPEDFKAEDFERNKPVALASPQSVLAFFDETDGEGIVKSFDGMLQVQKRGSSYEMFTPKAKGSGGKYYLNSSLLQAIGGDFYSVSNRMRATMSAAKLSEGLQVLMDGGTGFKVDSHKVEAQKIAQELDRLPASLSDKRGSIDPVDRSTYENPRRTDRADRLQRGLQKQIGRSFPEGSIFEVDPKGDSVRRKSMSGAELETGGPSDDNSSGLRGRRQKAGGQGRSGKTENSVSLPQEAKGVQAREDNRQGTQQQSSRGISKGLPEQLSKIASIFGKEVAFIASDERILHGEGYAPRWSNTVFLRPDANQPHLLILGHEIVHYLKRDAPVLYNKLSMIAQTQRKGNSWKQYHDEINELARSTGEKGLTSSQSYEELLADFSGEQFMDPDFWLELATEEPTLFSRVARKIRRMIDKVLAVFGKSDQSSRYFRDIQKVRDSLVSVLAEYGRQQNGKPSSRQDGKTSGRHDGNPIHFSKTSTIRNPTSVRSVRGAVQELQARAENALPLEVVNTFEDLPEHIRTAFDAQGGGYCEACNDPKTGKVWMVAENVFSRKRAVELWMHEQGAHHGLRGLLGDSDYVQLLRKVGRAAKHSKEFKNIALDYDYDLFTDSGRDLASHEYLAQLAEKVDQNEVLTQREKSVWRKVVDAVMKWLAKLRIRLPGSLTRREINKLVADAVFWTVHGDGSTSPSPKGGAEAVSYSRSNPVREPAMAKIGQAKEKTTISDRIGRIRDFMATEFSQGMFDRFASLKDLDKAAGVTDLEESAYVAARMSTSHADQIAAVIEHGAPIWREGAMDVEGEGLATIFEPVAHELDRFTGWLVGLRAKKLMAEGRENLFTEEEIDELCSLNSGREAQYEAVQQKYIAFKTKVLDFAQDAGVINAAGRTLWEHDEYIPFYRINETGEEKSSVKSPHGSKGIANQYSGIRRLRGGTSNLGDPFENIIRNFSHLIDSSVKNRAMELAMVNAENIGVATNAEFKWEGLQLKGQALRSSLVKVYGDADAVAKMTKAQSDSLQTVFRMVKPDAVDVVSVLRDGKPVYYHIADPLLLRALTSVNLKTWNNFGMKTARLFKRMLTTGVTSTPDFMIRNIVRDTVHAWGVDRTGTFVPVVGSFKGAIKTLSNDEDTVKMMAAGAAFHGGYAFGHDPAAAKLLVEKLVKKHKVDPDSILDTPKKLAKFAKLGWMKWQDLGSAFENATRARLYEGVKKKGGTHLEAAYEAKDIMDYSMGGDWLATRFLCETVPFFGARMVGLNRLGRGAYENPSGFMTKGAMVALASVLLYLNNRDREEFKELEHWDRDNYYHFFVEDKHFRMPKPFEIGAIFGTLPERLTEYSLNGKDGDLLRDRLQFMLTQTFSVGTPQIVTPVLEQWADKSFFTGRAIVPMRLKRLQAGAQRDHRTSETAAVIGEKTGTSPKRIEHLVNGYFGTLGVYVMSMADIVTRKMVDAPELPSRRLDDMPIIKSFYRSTPSRHSRHLTELYDMVQEADELYSTVMNYAKTGEAAKAKALVKDPENRKILAKRQPYNQLRRALGQIETAMRQIHRSRKLTQDEKRAKIDGLLEKRNLVVRRVMEN